ncbi:MAG: tetratricopeptide repeat protein [Alphaproteobacteria bacterium]|nr:tetratricopeptide repeat protein [Alphaproteobacteria bacterium]
MSYQLMFQKAVELQQNGALNEAEQIYRQILETAPNNADVLNLLGLIAQTRGIHSEAVGYFYKAIENAPQHWPIFFNLAVSLGALGKSLEATEAYQKVLSLKPDCKEAHFGLGNLYWAQNNLEDAKEQFSAALKIDSDYTAVATNLAEVSDDTDSLEKLSAGNPQALYYLGRRAFNARNFTSAAKYLSNADALTQDDEIKSMLGESELALGHKEQAQKLFYQALSINPHNLSALMNLADMEADSHNFGEAEKFYKRGLEIAPDNLRLHTNYAEMLCRNKRTLEGLEEYRQAVILSPQTPELSYNLSLILKSLEEYEQALDLMFHAFYLASKHTDWSLNIAETLVLFNEQAPEKARKICENWYQKMPENIIVQHLWSAINHQTAANEKEYNALLFDNFAATYEQTLKNIQYSVVDKIAELYAPLKGKILDLGCGTGLVAQKLKNDGNTFVGIDISAKMLELARQKNVYTELHQADILTYLSDSHSDFDAVIAADVFCYFGDLRSIIAAVSPTRLIFSIETDSTAEKFTIQANGRYKHNPQYIELLLRNSGYTEITQTELILRRENGKDVVGCIISARIT